MGWKPVRESPFGSPGSRRGDTAGPPSVTGASSARPRGANLGGTAEGCAFRPMVWDGGFFLFPRPPEAAMYPEKDRRERT